MKIVDKRETQKTKKTKKKQRHKGARETETILTGES